jgi:hypothetical protein
MSPYTCRVLGCSYVCSCSRKRLVWPEPSGINECSCPVRLDRGALLVGTGHHLKVMFQSVRSGLHTLVRLLSLPRAAFGLHDRHPSWIIVWSRKCLRRRATPSVSRLHSWSLWGRYTAVVPCGHLAKALSSGDSQRCGLPRSGACRHTVVRVPTCCDRLLSVVRFCCALSRSAGVLVGLPSSRLSRHTCGGSSRVLAVACLRHTVVVLGRGCGQNHLTLPLLLWCRPYNMRR